MRLDFNVLWVEDQSDNVAGTVKTLQRVMAAEGFEFNHTFCSKLEEVNAYLADDLFKDEIDLILVDWDLGGGLKGNTVISQIRESIHYKDIIFYSANAAIDDLRKASFDEGHEGIYFVERDSLPREVDALFRSMIKKVLDLDHTRGIVMGATSDVDQTAREILQLAHDMLDGAGRDGILAEMIDLLDKKVADTTKAVDKLKKNPAIGTILGAHRTFTAYDGLRILARVLERDEFKDHVGHREHVTRYMNEIVPKRNDLGHKVLTPEGKPLGIAGPDGTVISIDDMKALRCALLELRNEFQVFHGALAAT